MKTNFLKDKANVKFAKYPWPHIVIDNFLPSKDFKKIQKRLTQVNSGFKKRDNDILDLNYQLAPDYQTVKFFIGEDFKRYLEELTRTKLELYENGLVQLRLMNGQSPEFPPHTDQQKEKSYVCLFYLSPDWTKKCGGELRLHKKKSSKLKSDETLSLPPIENRMVLFLSTNKSWHSVNKVKNWKRYSLISEWIVRGSNEN